MRITFDLSLPRPYNRIINLFTGRRRLYGRARAHLRHCGRTGFEHSDRFQRDPRQNGKGLGRNGGARDGASRGAGVYPQHGGHPACPEQLAHPRRFRQRPSEIRGPHARRFFHCLFTELPLRGDRAQRTVYDGEKGRTRGGDRAVCFHVEHGRNRRDRLLRARLRASPKPDAHPLRGVRRALPPAAAVFESHHR